MEISYFQALIILLTTQLLGSLYLYKARKKAQPGLQRLVVAIPVILSNLFAPLLFTRRQDATTITLVAFNTAWLSTFKTILWSLNRSTLSDPRLSFIQFAAIHLIALTPLNDLPPHRRATATTQEEAIAPPSTLLRWAVINITMLVVNVFILQQYQHMHPVIRAFFYALALYALLSTIMDGPGAIASSFFGIVVTPHFDKPWLSSSVATFWNKRWDLSAGNALRLLMYEPIIQGSLVHVGDHDVTIAAAPAGTSSISGPRDRYKNEREGRKEEYYGDDAEKKKASRRTSEAQRWRHVAGSIAAFLTSGLVHEAIHWYLTGHFSGGCWLSFFLLQIPAVLGERIVRKSLQDRGIVPPRAIMILYCVLLECYLSAHFFWGPAEKAEISKDIIQNVSYALKSLVL